MDASEPEVGDATLEASLRDRQALATHTVSRRAVISVASGLTLSAALPSFAQLDSSSTNTQRPHRR